tara:strand:+ start:31 stop:336 length:306 start_codon:yes stop_codon:yes gene_type:complete
MSKKDVESLMDEALENIRNDRTLARDFLNEIANQIAHDGEKNRQLSPVAAQHVQSLQRSNEQLVKIISLRLKTQQESAILSDEDKNSLFDLIQGQGDADVQ